MLSRQIQRVSALLWTTEVNSCLYSWFVFTIKKSKESELTELIKLILLKHDRVVFFFLNEA